MKDKIGVIIHPIDRRLLCNYEPGMKRLGPNVADKILEWMSPFHAGTIEGAVSVVTKEKLDVDLVMCPLLLEQMASLSPRRALNKVIKAVRFAEAREARAIALVAYTALVGGRGVKVQEASNVPITTGNHLSLAAMPESVLSAIGLLGKSSYDMKMFIFGANPLAYAFVHRMGHCLKKIYLCHPAVEKNKTYLEALPNELKKKVKIVNCNPITILGGVDIVVNATSRYPSLLNERLLKSGSIIFDASYPRTINISRKDLLLMDGAMMRPPGGPNFNFNFNFNFPTDLCYPCIAEPMVLAFEDRYESYSLGKDFSMHKVDIIWELAIKHGFDLGPITSYERIIPKDKIDEVKRLSSGRHSFMKVFDFFKQK